MTTPSPTTSSESLGRTSISEKVVTRIVAAAADSVPGTTEQTRSLDNITARRYPRFDVEINEDTNTVSVEAYIAVIWPSPVTAVAARVRDTIAAWVERTTHFTVSRVNVVTGTIVRANPQDDEALTAMASKGDHRLGDPTDSQDDQPTSVSLLAAGTRSGAITRDLLDASPLTPELTDIVIRPRSEVRSPSTQSHKAVGLTAHKPAPLTSHEVRKPEVPPRRELTSVETPAPHSVRKPEAPLGHRAITPKSPGRHRAIKPQALHRHRVVTPSSKKVVVRKQISVTPYRSGTGSGHGHTAPITVRKLRPTSPIVINRAMPYRAQEGVGDHE